MKKITRKALLTAKLYRPGKAGGGMLMPGHPQREVNLAEFLRDNHPDVPHVLYHRTSKNFSKFKPGGSNPELSGPAIWLGDDPEHLPQMHNRHQEGDNIMPVHVSMKNPLLLDEFNREEMQHRWAGGNKEFPYLVSEDIRDRLKAAGFDGIIAQNPMGGEGPGRNEYIVFDGNQLKSATGNRGTFDPNEDDTNKAAGGRTGYADGGMPEDEGIHVYHSSPHDFDQFSDEFMGTGEGNQAFGHGLYFAEAPEVSGQGGRYWQQFWNRMKSGPEASAASALYNSKFDRQKAIENLGKTAAYHLDRATKNYGDGPEVMEGHRLLHKQNEDAADLIRSGGIIGPRTYEARIKANPEHFWDWDAPISGQHEKVLNALAPFFPAGIPQKNQYGAPLMGGDIYRQVLERAGGVMFKPVLDKAGVEERLPGGTPARLSRYMLNMGVPGIRYFDAGSRVHKGGSRNYVVFDPKIVNVKKKYEYGGIIERAAGGRTGYADGGTPARVVDQNNFYSKADHEARKLSQKKGSPQQIRAMLEKAGVKPEEIDQSGYNETFGDRPSVTTDEVAQHFRDKLPKLNVKRLLSGLHDDFDPDSGNETRFDPYTLYGQTNYREHLLKLPEKEGEPSFQESNHWPSDRNVVAHVRMGDRGTPVDPEMAKATINKMLADNQMMSLLSREPGNWGSGAADYALERGTITPEEALNLSRYRRWHNDVTANAKPEKNLHVEEIQSDWAQQGRKQGFAEPGIPPKPTAAQRRQEFQAFVSSLREPFIRQHRENMSPDDTPEERDAVMQMVHHLTRDMNTNHTNARLVASALGREDEFNRFFQNWIDAPIEPETLPRGPFVTSTPGWTNLALKHVLSEAVKGGYDRIVFSPGQANVDMYPGLEEKQQNGLRSFYDQILPTQMNKLAKSLDPDHPGMRMFAHTLPPVALSDDTEGYKGHALDITDDLRDAVNKGLPMFKRGGEVRGGYQDGGTPKTNAMGFYSKAAQVARSLPQKKASGAQMIAMLADPKRGVKRDELINAGLLTRDGKPNKWQDRIITSDDLADYLERSVPQLGEVNSSLKTQKSFPYSTAEEWDKAVEEAENRGDYETVSRLFDDYEAWVSEKNNQFNAPKYEQYTLPGGENYREVLLHLPVQGNGPKDNFQSFHWDEPNVVAHLRMKDRVGRNGEKVLHVEEIQSDWGQKGRDEGFYDPDRTFEVYDWDKGKVLSQHATEEEAHAAADALPPDTPLNIRLAHTGNQPVAPVGPYVTSTEGWTDLALKRAMQEAAKGGYDKLVVSPGQANADLYGLSKQVEALSYDPDQRQLSFKKKNGSWDDIDGEVKPEDLPRHIGKDYAKALMATQPHPLSGNHILENLDTNVGGEGMRKFYDRDVPQRLQKLAGSMDPDAKVQMGAFPLTNQYQGHALDITDKMRAAVQQGLPAFKQGGMAATTHPMLQKAMRVARNLTRR